MLQTSRFPSSERLGDWAVGWSIGADTRAQTNVSRALAQSPVHSRIHLYICTLRVCVCMCPPIYEYQFNVCLVGHACELFIFIVLVARIWYWYCTCRNVNDSEFVFRFVAIAHILGRKVVIRVKSAFKIQNWWNSIQASKNWYIFAFLEINENSAQKYSIWDAELLSSPLSRAVFIYNVFETQNGMKWIRIFCVAVKLSIFSGKGCFVLDH